VFKNYLAGLKPGKYFLCVEKNSKLRSVQQNRYLWGVVYKMISDDTGYTPEEVHFLMKKQFLSYEKNGVEFLNSTTKLKAVDFDTYIENIRRFAAMELSINIPDPQ
jgi:hypothetical protein